jgi:hypothetical protein
MTGRGVGEGTFCLDAMWQYAYHVWGNLPNAIAEGEELETNILCTIAPQVFAGFAPFLFNSTVRREALASLDGRQWRILLIDPA